MNEPKIKKDNSELEPGVNTVLYPDSDNPGPTDMIEDAVGDIIDNITGHPKNKTTTSENKPNK